MLLSLEQCGFRNLKEFSLDFSEGITIISGQNGHGKSNLLEAIHIICQGFSFRTKTLQEAIDWNAAHFILRAKTVAAFDEKNEAAIQVDNSGIKGKLNGKEFRRASALFGSAPLVFISPEDIRLAKGTPENRRSFLDELLCFCKKSNLDLLRRYRRVLQQRNRWLKDNLEGNAAGGEYLFEALTEQLASLAVLVWEERKELCGILEPHINNFYQILCNKSEEIKFSYARALSREDFLKSLKEKFNAERAAGATLAGPHRDDIELFLQGHSMRDFGSQGQCRSIALAMKFAAAEIIENHSGTKPILLLDDVFAELDHSRREAVAKIVKQKECQTFAATPSKEDLPFQGDSCLDIGEGSVMFGSFCKATLAR
ncbi:MAG: DNA replication and repair protein RecF [Candidatus Fibromonas sp.]|jgi:DNA replication and repair protein RecF|nr:DNA replication and repair protein RecF [Candidatus Fibromonas sp.]